MKILKATIFRKSFKIGFLNKIAKATTFPNCLVLAVFQLFSPFQIPPINQKLTFCSKMIAQYYDRWKMIVPKSFDYFWNENDRENDRTLIWSLAKKLRLKTWKWSIILVCMYCISRLMSPLADMPTFLVQLSEESGVTAKRWHVG